MIVGACAFSSAAHADLPNTAPVYGGDSLEAIGASLEHSVSASGQNDAHEDALRAEAERRMRADGDAASIVGGSVALSFGATLLIGGIGLASSATWGANDCAACMPSVLLVFGGAQLTVLGLVSLFEYGGPHRQRHHRRHVDELVHAMSLSSIEAARTARAHRLTLGWSLFASGAVLVGSSVALFAMGHQAGFDDGVREALAGGSAFLGSWLTTLGTGELATKWTNEMALAPTRGGAMLGYERRW